MMPHAASRDVSGLLAEGVAEPVAGAEPALDRLPVRLDGEIRLLPVAEVLYCYANGDRTMLVTRGGEMRSHFSLSRLAERLAPFLFFVWPLIALLTLGD